MILNRRRSGPAVALLIAAVAAPSASARPIDTPVGTQSPDTTGGPQVRVVEVPTDAGFDWTGAGLGAGAMLAATGLGGALMLTIRRRHGRAASAA
jgi:hypothetical protein